MLSKARIRRRSEAVALYGAVGGTDPAARGPRGGVVAAFGLSMAGTRATASLSGPDLAGALDLLASAAGQHLSLVVHLSSRAQGGSGAPVGSGHEAYHQLSLIHI